MSTTIASDETVFAEMQDYLGARAAGARAALSYVTAHCTLGDASGLLLSGLVAPYAEARDACFEGFTALGDLLEGLRDRVADHERFVADQEAENVATLEEMMALLEQAAARLDDLQGIAQRLAAQPVATTGAAGGGGGAGAGGLGGGASAGGGWAGGGGSGGGSAGAAAPPTVEVDGALTGAPTPVPSADQEGSGVQVVVGDGSTVTVTVGDGNTVHVGAPATTPGATTGGTGAEPGHTPDGETGADPDACDGAVDGVEEDPLDALLRLLGLDGADEGPAAGATDAQQAADAAVYTRLWARLAEEDPLGRSAAELQAAWAAREPVTMPEGALDQLGVREATTVPGGLDLRLTLTTEQIAALRAGASLTVTLDDPTGARA